MALGLAVLGAAVHALRPRLRAAALLGAAALVAVACWPLARGVGDRAEGLLAALGWTVVVRARGT